MQKIVGVRFKKAGKVYYFAPGDREIETGDGVIVETARGVEFGRVVIGPREVEDKEVVQPLKEVQRKATSEDWERVRRNAEQEKEAFDICREKIELHKLPMNLLYVEYTFDVNKIIFYFTADGRVDFRELVKDLAAIFRTRIELRQVGVRDEAKFIGGIGGCGRPLCCTTFLGDFVPVSIRMAKDQGLSLNPTKISGVCSRLMCCLKYENDCYAGRGAARKKILPPKQGGRVVTVEGEGKVINLNMQRRTTTILLDDRRTIVAAWEDVVEKDEDTLDMNAPVPEDSPGEDTAQPEPAEPGEQPAGEPRPDKVSGEHSAERTESGEPEKSGKRERSRAHKGSREHRERKDNREHKERKERDPRPEGKHHGPRRERRPNPHGEGRSGKREGKKERGSNDSEGIRTYRQPWQAEPSNNSEQ